ncbi:MAG TPA: PA2778 family cysteine peptidase, partial [Alphaproteobacteria bacterium]|nr:PA2778 family cysteine peptidase [Alphaproteobacteria bacterium]
CGPAALAMVLAWSGSSVTQDEIGAQVYTPGREGTLQTDILAGARRNGRLAVEVNDLRSLLTELTAGHPVLVFQNLGLSDLPQWHYAVAIGYELEPGNLTLHSGLEERRVLSFEVFERTWARSDHWALVVLPPDRLPATAGLDAVLTAAVAIERVGRPADAAIAYATIAGKWPQSYAAWMGLGNSRYALAEFAAAERAFRSAIQAQPEAPQAWNNLAYTLAEQGRRGEAIAAAERAVALGGAEAEQYRATLKELTAAPTS